MSAGPFRAGDVGRHRLDTSSALDVSPNTRRRGGSSAQRSVSAAQHRGSDQAAVGSDPDEFRVGETWSPRRTVSR
jgi:hypothetical protein